MSADPPAAAFREGLDPVPYDLDSGLAHLGLFGVRYFATFTDGGAHDARSRPELTSVAEGPGFAVFELERAAPVSVARRLPVVVEGRDFARAARAWFGRVDRLDEWLAAEGPSDWPRATGDPSSWAPAPPISDSGSVGNVEDRGDRLSFSTTAVGVPHLVRVSHFPNWRVEGASGPYPAAPSLMLVVPTQERVTLVFGDTWVEWVGRGVTGLAASTLLVGVGLAFA